MEARCSTRTMHEQSDVTLPDGTIVVVDKGLEELVYEVNRLFVTLASCIGDVPPELEERGVRGIECAHIVFTRPKGLSTFGFLNACEYLRDVLFRDENKHIGRTSLEIYSGAFPFDRGEWAGIWRFPKEYIPEWTAFIRSRISSDDRFLLDGAPCVARKETAPHKVFREQDLWKLTQV